MAPVATEVGPARSLIHQWLADGVAGTGEGILVWDPRFVEPSPHRGIAVLPMEDPGELFFGDEQRWLRCRADAYASDRRSLLQAIAYLSSPRTPPGDGPLRLTYLGSLGTARTATAIGCSVPVDQRRVLGRGSGCDLVTRQGPHSDQNITARAHAVVEPRGGGVVVSDLRSTNGTYLDGALVTGEVVASSGAELALAGRIRIRVDGSSSLGCTR